MRISTLSRPDSSTTEQERSHGQNIPLNLQIQRSRKFPPFNQCIAPLLGEAIRHIDSRQSIPTPFAL